jgi:hypothetical protein
VLLAELSIAGFGAWRWSARLSLRSRGWSATARLRSTARCSCSPRDMAVQLAANRLGFTPLKGGSVLQRVERWRVRPLAELQDAVRRGYLEELGLSGEGTRAEVGTRVLAQRGRALAQDRRCRCRARARAWPSSRRTSPPPMSGSPAELGGRTVAPSEVAKRVAAKLKELDDEFEREARSVNLFNKTKELSQASRRARAERARAQEARRNLRTGEGGGGAGDRRPHRPRPGSSRRLCPEARRTDHAARGKQHYHRIYDVKALKEDRDGAVEALEQAYRRTHHQNPRLAAEAAYDQITLDPAGDIQGQAPQQV